MNRREFLTVSATSVGGVLVYSLDRKVSRETSTSANHNNLLKIPLRFLTRDEALIVGAAAARIFPSDDSGPGANEAGVAIYIDRQLAGPWGKASHRYMQEPFDENAPAEFGYQGKANPQEIYRGALKDLKGFETLSGVDQDHKLHEIEHTLFFSMLRRNTIEGMFSDPLHGGNIDMVGWQLVGFPGPRMNYFGDVDKHFGEKYRPKPVSLRQVVDVPIHPTEDEK
jgi:gluconate 2-dehydrogenase gamma chain